jgi:hypothetical protein
MGWVEEASIPGSFQKAKMKQKSVPEKQPAKQ